MKQNQNNLPVVIWFIGISGAGKSTLAGQLRNALQARGIQNCLIDGDETRAFFDHDLGFSREERIANIQRILLAAHLLSQSGVAVVVANISPFEDLRQFARRKINNYHQIHLKKELAVSLEADVRRIYRNHLGKSDLVGVDIPFEEPLNSELTIDVDRQTPEQSLRTVLEFLNTKYPHARL
jgi:adenylylsulfate kinase-like enzyme